MKTGLFSSVLHVLWAAAVARVIPTVPCAILIPTETLWQSEPALCAYALKDFTKTKKTLETYFASSVSFKTV
jgi:hypothetical protein